MKVYCLANTGGPRLLVEDSRPIPHPAHGEVLVRVHAAGITPTELLWYPTSHTPEGKDRERAIPSHEFSGTVAAVGNGVEGWAVGDEVFGLNDWYGEGALAEYCVTRADFLAPKPQTLRFSEAASVPISALTAWQGLFERAKLASGEDVFVQGGAGAVGVFAIQLANWHGAHVTATSSGESGSFVAGLGAQEVIDRDALPADLGARFDVVFDTVGGPTLEKTRFVMRPSGRLVTVAASGDAAADERTKDAFFIVQPNQEQLGSIGRLLDDHVLRAVVDSEVKWQDIPAAYLGHLARTHRGKMVALVES